MEETSEKKLLFDIKQLPKIELHVHLGGSVRPATIKNLLEEKNYKNSDELVYKSMIHGGIDDILSPSEQMERFEIISKATSNIKDKERVTKEFLEDCDKENIVYVELRTGGDNHDKIEAILKTFEECKRNGIITIPRLILSVNREWSFDKAEEVIKRAIYFKNRGVVGVDFSGDPKKGRFQQFSGLFSYAIKSGLPFTSHFAESPCEEDLIDILNVFPSRLGHACYMNNKIRNRVYENKIPIEACLASNINTMRLYYGIQDHPIMTWIKDKHPTVLCTDNPGILQCTLSGHYEMVQKACNLNWEELWQLSESSIDFTFADNEVKQTLKNIFKEHKLNPRNKNSSAD